MQHTRKLLLIVLVVMMLAAPTATAQEPVSAIEQHKTLAVQTIDMLWNTDHTGANWRLLRDIVRIHTPVASQSSVTADESYVVAVLEDYHRAFPDLVMTVDHVAAEGDLVFLHVSAEGTFDGIFTTPYGNTIQPNGASLDWEDVFIYRFEDGKIKSGGCTHRCRSSVLTRI